MATGDVIDFQQLLDPIPGDSPSGVELMDDESRTSVFLEIRSEVKSARDAEQRLRKKALMDRLSPPQSDRDKETGDPSRNVSVEPPNWERVYELATDILATKSKDMWVAAWLIDALTRLHGFAGLRDGFRLVRELSEKYWETIHPKPDERGYEKTFSQLAGLANGALTVPIAEVPITGRTSVGPIRSTDYVDAPALEKIKDAKLLEQQIERGAISLEMIKDAVKETPDEFFVTLINDIDQALVEHTKMTQLLTERCGKSEGGVPIAPTATHIRKSLEECRTNVMAIAGDVIKKAMSEPTPAAGGGDVEEGAQGVASGETEGGSQPSPGSIQSRKKAFQTLDQLAKFFRKTEPLSPVSYELEKIVRWGDMEFPDLMKELISKPEALNDLFRQTGVNSKGGGADEKPAS